MKARKARNDKKLKVLYLLLFKYCIWGFIVFSQPYKKFQTGFKQGDVLFVCSSLQYKG
jgi:hypothetical protein